MDNKRKIIQSRPYYHFAKYPKNLSRTPIKQLTSSNYVNNGSLLFQPCRLKKSISGGDANSKIKVVWNTIFGKYLLLTNVVGSGILMVIGDVAAQAIEQRREHSTVQGYDFERIGRMFVVGALQGPLHHYVYNWMDKVMPVANLGNVVKKILIDQLFMSPMCIFIFFYSACYLEKKTLKETNDELREKFLFIYCMDWLLWPGAQYINFRYLDTKYRVTFVNVCTALYNIFMSYVKHDY
ncbi:mpv17-like protein 2 [Musca vetustissima]|uniref:mpv17-like protein 2 n=1 Tax=Musca vetustissima TaxID=27455 RepID=UPI002AB6E9DC|nr:mpv17-like protein 2 [Musca vetustissima]